MCVSLSYLESNVYLYIASYLFYFDALITFVSVLITFKIIFKHLPNLNIELKLKLLIRLLLNNIFKTNNLSYLAQINSKRANC